MEKDKEIEKTNKIADEKVHNELEQSSMIIMIVCVVVGSITVLSGLSEEGIAISTISSGASLIIAGYVSSLVFRWMASVLRQLNDIKTKK